MNKRAFLNKTTQIKDPAVLKNELTIAVLIHYL